MEHTEGYMMPVGLRKNGFLAIGCLLAGLTGCGMPPAADEEVPEIAIDCGGKCDGLTSIKKLWKGYENLDLNDLVSLGAGFATDELNDALSFGPLGFDFEAPRHFALAEDAAGDLTLGNLDALVSGLAARFGDHDLTTEVNRVRREHLAASSDRVYTEASFRMRASEGKTWNWRHRAEGLDQDLSAWVGFRLGAEVESRVVAPFRREISGTGKAVLQALQEARGFVLPTSLEDLREMEPGEMIARRGEGTAAVNMGVGVPLLVAEPIEYLTYTIMFSAAFHAGLSGELDVQLVRLEGDEVVVDVGIDAVCSWKGEIAIHDGWGAAGLFRRTFTIAGKVVDLGEMADKALTKQLDRKLDILNVHAGLSRRGSRLSIARFRFHLDRVGEHFEQALAQALRGDVRLAQALSAGGAPGIETLYDLSRSGVSATSGAGIDIFGMSFFSDTIEQEGSVVIQEPGSARVYLFESLEREGGWFVSSHGYTRAALAGLTFTTEGATGEANLFVQIAEGDYFTQPDKLLDHLDGLILGYGGWDTFEAVSLSGNDLQDDNYDAFWDCVNLRDRECRQDPLQDASECERSDYYDVCREETLSDGWFADCVSREVASCEREQGDDSPDCWHQHAWASCVIDAPSQDRVADAYRDVLRDLDGTLGYLDDASYALLGDVIDLRLAVQSLAEMPAGPPVSMAVDFRLDDAAMTELMLAATPDQIKSMILDYVTAQYLDRRKKDNRDEIQGVRETLWRETGPAIVEIAGKFAEAQDAYRRIQEFEYANLQQIGAIGARALQIRLEPDADRREKFRVLAAESLTWARARLMTELFDDLVRAGRDIQYCRDSNIHDGQETCFDRVDFEEQLAAYLLLRLTPAASSEVRVDIDMDLSGNFWAGDMTRFLLAGYRNLNRYVRGPAVAPIEGGLFEIDSLPDPLVEFTD